MVVALVIIAIFFLIAGASAGEKIGSALFGNALIASFLIILAFYYISPKTPKEAAINVIAEAIVKADSIKTAKIIADSLELVKARNDSIKAVEDSIKAREDSVKCVAELADSTELSKCIPKHKLRVGQKWRPKP